jgi:hypothetical protein
LQQQLPRLVMLLALGDPSIPFEDLHVAIVSATSPGRPDVAPPCAADYPAFLRYHGPYFGIDSDDTSGLLAAVACNARLGSAGDNRNQALEAAVAALSGPTAIPGFLRNDPVKGLSLLSIVVVADSDDCSGPSDATANGAPLTTTAACAQSDANLQSIEHYAQALLALRPDNPNLITFSAITGVPEQLVSEKVLRTVDLTKMQSRDAFYQAILSDPRMQVAVDPDAPDRLKPVCANVTVSTEPGPRLAQMAQRFGANGTVASICSDDWRSALGPLIALPTPDYGSSRCIGPRQRGPDGRVQCKLYWNLPPAELAPEGTFTQCSDRPYMQPAGVSRIPGGQRCEISQVAVKSSDEAASIDRLAGWYYDDFSLRASAECGDWPEEIVYTEFKEAQARVLVDIECHELQGGVTFRREGQSTLSCAAPETLQTAPAGFGPTALVGQACTPAVYIERGFDQSEVYVETGGGQCWSGACMVYHVGGVLPPHCVPLHPLQYCDPTKDTCAVQRCADPTEVQDRVYCTCRCASADPTAATCACPSGFSCRETFTQSGPGFDGSYCVKDGTFDEDSP